MATILNDAPYMGFPLSIKRGNPAPVDTTAVWYDKTELETYAATGATAYVGQILTLYADIPIEGGKTKKVCEAYMISNEAGTLVKLAQTTASGDLASDVATLQSQVADLIAAVGKKAAGEEAATGLYKEIADAVALANSKVASIGFLNNSLYADKTDPQNPKLSVAVAPGENALEITDAGLQVTIPDVKVPEYSIVTESSDDYAAVYRLTKDNVKVGAAINIPKDMVVQSGYVDTFHEGALPTGVTEPGTYIVLILANATNDKLYIPVSELIEYVTGGSGENDAIQINVTADTHKVTATVKEGSLTKAMLSTEVQGLLTKAGTAIQEITTGSANGNISVDGKDVAVKGLADAAYATVASLNTTAKGYADDAKAAIIGTQKDESSVDTIKGAKQYAGEVAASAKTEAEKTAKGYVDALDVTDTAVATQLVSAISQTDGKISVTRRALVAADIPELAQNKISGLETALAGKQDTVTFDGVYGADNKAATVSTVTSAISGVKGVYADASKDDETIAGAKKYADDKASTALTDAKSYADRLVTGDSGITNRVEALEGRVDVDKVSTAISTADEAVKAALIGSDSDDYTKNTIKGVKKYIDEIDGNLSSTIATVSEKANINETAITKLNGADTVEGSVDYKIKAAKNSILGDAETATETDKTIEGLSKKLTATTISLQGNIDTKQDKLGFEGTYNKTTNPVATKSYVDTAITTATAGLSGAMHFKGKVDELPVATNYDAGDVVIVGQKEYVLLDDKGTKSWSLLGDEGSYAVKGSIADADIATNADIDQSKIKGLTTTLAAKLDSTTAATTYVAKEDGKSLIADNLITKLTGIDTGAQVNKIESVKVNDTLLTITDKSVNIPAATASAFGVIKVDDTSIKATDGVIAIKAVSTDLLTQGTKTLILNCGGAAD